MKEQRMDLRNKIIVIFYMLYFGDMVSLSPFLSVLRRNAEGSRIILVIDSRFCESVAYNPNIDEIIPVDRKHMGMGATWGLGKEIGNKKPDILFVLHGTTRTTLMSLAMKPECWTGEAGTWVDGFFLNRKLLVERKDCHAAEKYVRVLRDIGVEDTEYDGMELFVSPEWQRAADDFYRAEGIGEDEKLAGFSVGSSTSEKNWPAERFGKLADRLAEKGYRSIFFGVSSEMPLIEKALSGMKHREDAIIAAGKLSMGEFMAAASRCAVAFTNDSGPMYVFDSRRVPTIAFFGPSNAKLHHPLGKRSVALASTDMPMTQDHVRHTIRDKNYVPIDAISLGEAIRAAEWALGEFESEEYAAHIKFIK